MKIQCDVCRKESATIFCDSDGAALCQTCDNQLHNANKLASKHPWFSLLNPRFKEPTRCDICQERRALLFCQEDRALLCSECDIPIHKTNELTKKHNRFLLTGIKLSAAASTYDTETSSRGSQSELNYQQSISYYSETASNPYRDRESGQPLNEQHSDSTNSISQYLMETIPGWHVEHFLDHFSNYRYCKIHEQINFSFTDEDSKPALDFLRQRHSYVFI